MARTATVLCLGVLLLACSAVEEQGSAQITDDEWLEGTYEYLPPLRGQSIATGGRFVYLYGPADGSQPMTGEAGTYEIRGDTVWNVVRYATDSTRVGLTYLWTPDSIAGDTIAFLVLNDEGEVTGRGRGVRIR